MHTLNYKIEEALKKHFNIFMIEFPKSSECLKRILLDIQNAQASDYLHKNLLIDFAFMPAIYGLISLWLWMLSWNRSLRWKRLLKLFIMLQVAAWGLDITENIILLNCLATPNSTLTTSVAILKLSVPVKFACATGGVILGLIAALRI